MVIRITSRQLATILAALCYWQQDLDENDEDPISEHIADGTQPLTVDEIDRLCEQLNSQ